MDAETLRPTSVPSQWPNPDVPRPVPLYTPQEAADRPDIEVTLPAAVDVHGDTYDTHLWYGVVTIWATPEGMAKTEFRMSSVPSKDALWMSEVMGVPYLSTEHLLHVREEVYQSALEDYDRRFPERQVLNVSVFMVNDNFTILPKRPPRTVSVGDPNDPDNVIQVAVKPKDQPSDD